MNNKIFDIFKIVILLLIIFLIIFFIFKSILKDDSNILILKIDQEINFIENKLIYMTNSINNVSFKFYNVQSSKIDNSNNKESNDGNESNSDVNNENKDNYKYELNLNSILNVNNNNEIDWNYLKVNIEIIYSSWTNLILDLNSLNIENNEILEISNVINDIIVSIKEENKILVLRNISRLYSYIPKLKEKYLLENEEKNVKLEYIKYYSLSSYCLLEEDNFEQININLSLAKNYFIELLNKIDKENDIIFQNKLSKNFILLNELINTVFLKDKGIFLLKYKLLMEDLI